jgi:hypothetical protein
VEVDDIPAAGHAVKIVDVLCHEAIDTFACSSLASAR